MKLCPLNELLTVHAFNTYRLGAGIAQFHSNMMSKEKFRRLPMGGRDDLPRGIIHSCRCREAVPVELGSHCMSALTCSSPTRPEHSVESSAWD